MPVIVIVGAQWGDEGKGRVVDYFASQAAVVARFNGGDNAGHTVIAEGHKLALHLIPSGILYPHVTCLIGAGTVVNPLTLLREIQTLRDIGVDVSPAHLKLSAAAHLVLPTHRVLDGASDLKRGYEAIGTTKRGIGPAYADKMERVGLRAGQMRDPNLFAEAVGALVDAHNNRLVNLYGLPAQPVGQIVAQLHQAAGELAPYLVDGTALIGQALAEGKLVIGEGAQGTLLDINLGTYPFVTSSSPVSGGVLTGLGIGPKEVTRVIGIAKAYTTRVGAGPFPTELNDALGEHIREVGHEYGTTTGRPRRCGWLDAVLLRYAAQVNGLTDIALSKLDILSGLPSLRIAVAYELDGERIEHFPAEWGAEVLNRCHPIYEELPAWQEDISGVRRREDLPAAAQTYIARIEALTGVPVTFISVGPEREAMIIA
ncbi:MAG TPA: adenylosuccinate synthase [Anaerolineae bacterium]|nr:adenylosuccinate synthase [Anaerolineae bacterium]HQK15049.1 adenylosuccinate synthase [Anaerolineae bacterium]